MIRFLRYALERDRKLRMMLTLDGRIVQRTVRVLTYDGESVTLMIGARKAPVTIPLADVLACDYARGDHGEE